MKLFFLSILILLLSCKKDSKDQFLQMKKNKNFVLWKNIETITVNDFGQKNNDGNSIPFIKIITGIDVPKNELNYFVYFDKEKSKLNINQPKDSIENILLYTNLKMDCYEIVARKYVEKFKKAENMKIENRDDSKYITNEIVADTELELQKLTDRIWYSKFNEDTISEIKIELNNKLK